MIVIKFLCSLCAVQPLKMKRFLNYVICCVIGICAFMCWHLAFDCEKRDRIKWDFRGDYFITLSERQAVISNRLVQVDSVWRTLKALLRVVGEVLIRLTGPDLRSTINSQSKAHSKVFRFIMLRRLKSGRHKLNSLFPFSTSTASEPGYFTFLEYFISQINIY